jgi:hypothetical protein
LTREGCLCRASDVDTPTATEQSLNLTLHPNKGNKLIAEKRQRRGSKDEATRHEGPEESIERSLRAREKQNLFQEEEEKVRVFVQNHFKKSRGTETVSPSGEDHESCGVNHKARQIRWQLSIA